VAAAGELAESGAIGVYGFAVTPRRITASEIVWQEQHPPGHPEIDAAVDAYWDEMTPKLLRAWLTADEEQLEELRRLRRRWQEEWRPELDRLWRDAFGDEPPPKPE
jgi:hypothetical protein